MPGLRDPQSLSVKADDFVKKLIKRISNQAACPVEEYETFKKLFEKHPIISGINEQYFLIRRVAKKSDEPRFHVATELLNFRRSNLRAYSSRGYFYYHKDEGKFIYKKYNCFIKLTFLRKNSLGDVQSAHDQASQYYGRIDTSASGMASKKFVMGSGNRVKMPLIFTRVNEELILYFMPFLAGDNIKKYIDCKKYRSDGRGHPSKRSEFDRKLDMTLLVIKEIKKLHDENCYHGDIKPENIIYDNASNTVSLIDFDSVNIEGEETTISCYTRHYAAPENYSLKQKVVGNTTKAQDIYSLAGVIGYIFFGEKFLNSDKERYRDASKFLPYNTRSLIKQPPWKRKQISTLDLDHWLILYYLRDNMTSDQERRPDIHSVLKFFENIKEKFSEPPPKSQRVSVRLEILFTDILFQQIENMDFYVRRSETLTDALNSIYSLLNALGVKKGVYKMNDQMLIDTNERAYYVVYFSDNPSEGTINYKLEYDEKTARYLTHGEARFQPKRFKLIQGNKVLIYKKIQKLPLQGLKSILSELEKTTMAINPSQTAVHSYKECLFTENDGEITLFNQEYATIDWADLAGAPDIFSLVNLIISKHCWQREVVAFLETHKGFTLEGLKQKKFPNLYRGVFDSGNLAAVQKEIDSLFRLLAEYEKRGRLP